MAKSDFQNLSREEKVSELVEALLLNEMGVVDPTYTRSYQEAKAATIDAADRMRLDQDYWKRANKLRTEGKTSSVDELKAQAEKMVDYTPQERLEAMSELACEARQRAAAK